MRDPAKAVSEVLEAVRAERPLVHNITNYVVMNFSANGLLALGASPVMAHALEEVEEMAGLAGALVINIGTLSAPWIEAMLAAGRAAKAKGIPIILDPVGAGATRLRTQTARRLIEELRPAVIRGNASEIIALTSEASGTKGVDATQAVSEAETVALALARKYSCVVAITGPEDYVTDGRRILRIANGHPLMGRITGSGCVATATIGACSAVQKDSLVATAAGLAIFGIAGELGARTNPRPGSYLALLIDGLDQLNPEHVRERLRMSTHDAPP